MKRLIITSAMLAAVIALICVHYSKVTRIEKIVNDSYDEILSSVKNEDFDSAKAKLNEIQTAWDKAQTWAGMTVSTDQLEEIDISLSQCREYAEISDKEDLVGEFVLFTKMIRHLPYYERATAESLL